MKKNLFYFLIVSAFLLSCKKEHASQSTPVKISGKKYKVVFNVSNFYVQKGGSSFLRSRSAGPVSLAAADSVINVSGYLDNLYLFAYDNLNGNDLISKVAQDSTMNNFGTITDSLAAGQYIIAIAAGKKGFVPINGTYVGAGTRFDQGSIWVETTLGYNNPNWQDTFSAYYILTVSAINANVYSVTLHRMVSKLQLHLTDAVPANAKSITMAYAGEASQLSVFDQAIDIGPIDTVSVTKQVTAADVGKTGFTLEKIIGNSSFYTDVILTAKDASNNVIAKVTVPVIKLKQNTTTILSGKLFGASASANSQSFQVKIDTAWNTSGAGITF